MGDPELISIYDVSSIFNRSIEAMRKYRTLGFITPYKRVGRKDLYKKEDIIISKYFIESFKKEGKCLREIAEAFKETKKQQNFEEKGFNDKETKKVLIIEDDGLVFDVLEKHMWQFFGQDKLEIYHAEDGLTGIKSAERIQPDLIVLDVTLPILSGIAVYEKLSNHPQLSHSKFIIISGNIEYKPKNEIFFSKPFKLTDLIETTKNLIGLEANFNQLVFANHRKTLSP
jgi:CheY-like chemotaxis protein